MRESPISFSRRANSHRLLLTAVNIVAISSLPQSDCLMRFARRGSRAYSLDRGRGSQMMIRRLHRLGGTLAGVLLAWSGADALSAQSPITVEVAPESVARQEAPQSLRRY